MKTTQPTDKDIISDLERSGANKDMDSIQSSPIEITGENDVEIKARQEKIFKNLIGDFTERENWRKPYDDLFDEIYNLYTVSKVTNGGRVPTRSQINPPKVYQIVESATPKLTAFTPSVDTIFDIETPDPKEAPIASSQKRLITDQMETAKFLTKNVHFVKQLVMYGTSYFYLSWNIVRNWVIKKESSRKAIMENGVRVGEIPEYKEVGRHLEVVKRGPEISPLDVLDVFPDGRMIDPNDGDGIFIRSFITKKEFRIAGEGNNPIYSNIEYALKDSSNKYEESRSKRKTSRGENTNSRRKDVELIEYWGKMDLDGDGFPEECVIVIANRKCIVKAVSLPYDFCMRPVFKGVFSVVPNEWFGMGLVEPIINDIYEMILLRRQRIDNVNLNLNAMWVASSDTDFDTSQLFTRPNGVILKGPSDVIERLPSIDVTQSAYADAQKIEEDIDKTTVPASLQGNAPAVDNVGTNRIIVNQAMDKFATAQQFIESTVLKPMLEFILGMNLQFLINDELTIANYGPIFDGPITPALVRRKSIFRLRTVSELTGKQEKVNQQIAYLSIPYINANISKESGEKIAKKIWEMMGLDPDIISFTVTPTAPFQGLQDLLANPPNVQGTALSTGVESAPVPGPSSMVNE